MKSYAPTVREIADKIVRKNALEIKILEALPEELGDKSLNDETVYVLARTIDEVRFSMTNRLKKVAGTDNIDTINKLVNRPETAENSDIQELAKQVKFLAILAQTVLHQ